MKTRLRLGVLVVGAVASTALSACVPSGSANGPHDPVRYATNGTFTIAVVNEQEMNPYATATPTVLAYDSLVNLRGDGRFASGLAQTWYADARSATFVLRSDVTCSDGEPLKASQVAADLNYLAAPGNTSPLHGVFLPTVPFKASGDDQTRTVRVILGRPFGFLLNTIGLTPIVCSKGLANPDMLHTASDGTGPFVLSDVVPGQSYTFTVRKGYRWGPGGATTAAPGTPAKVILRLISNQTTAANLLLSGGLNFASIIGADAQRLTADGLHSVKRNVSGAWLWFNQRTSRPTADVNVRQALVRALDFDQIIKVNTNGTGGGAATGLVETNPKPCPGDTVVGQLPAHDISAAEALLDRAGWIKDTDGTRARNGKPLTLNLHYTTIVSPLDRPTAELIAAQWKSIGVSVNLIDDGSNIGGVLLGTGNYDVYLYGFGLDLPSQMMPFVSGPVPPQGQNTAGINDAGYNALAAKASGLAPPQACAYWNKAEQALWNNLDVVPIANRPQLYFLKNAQVVIAGWDIPVPTSIRLLEAG